MIAERMLGYLPIGFRTLIAELPAPYDHDDGSADDRREFDG